MILQHGHVRLHINQLDYFMHRSSPSSTHLFLLLFNCIQLYSHRPIIYCNTRPCPDQLIHTATLDLDTSLSPSERVSLRPDRRSTTPHRDVRINFNDCFLGGGHFTSRQKPYPSIDTSGYFERQRSNNLHNVDGHCPGERICRCPRWTNPSTGRNDRGCMLETPTTGRSTVLQEPRALLVS